MLGTTTKLSRRLPFLLVFRATVATLILFFALAADILNWRLKAIALLLYAVVVITYAVVLSLALLLRAQTSPLILSTIHLVTSVIAAFVIVQGTGSIDSAFTFLYVLIILDGAIIGARHLALIMATICIMLHGAQLVFQLYGLLPAFFTVSFMSQPQDFIINFTTHLIAFYLCAFLAGQLAFLWQRAEENAALFEDQLNAQEHMVSLGKLSAAIAHEIRNPLAAISGCVELLVKTNDQPTHEKLKNIVLHEITRLNDLIEEFLVYARPLPPKLIATDISAITREICDVIKSHAVAENHRIEFNGPEHLLHPVDADQIKQMLWNLLKNAFEASPEAAPIQVRVAKDEKNLIFEIQDLGSGLTPEIKNVLFQPFHTTKPQGTGLGLAVVKRIVDGHGGSISFVTLAATGTVARVKLPVSFAS